MCRFRSWLPHHLPERRQVDVKVLASPSISCLDGIATIGQPHLWQPRHPRGPVPSPCFLVLSRPPGLACSLLFMCAVKANQCACDSTALAPPLFTIIAMTGRHSSGPKSTINPECWRCPVASPTPASRVLLSRASSPSFEQPRPQTAQASSMCSSTPWSKAP